MADTYILLTPEQISFEFVDDTIERNPIRELGSLRSVNLVVGANNARKSRLCRHLMQLPMLATSNAMWLSKVDIIRQHFDNVANSFPEGDSSYTMKRIGTVSYIHFIHGANESKPMEYYAKHNADAMKLVLNKEYFQRRLAFLLEPELLKDTKKLALLSQEIHKVRSELGILIGYYELSINPGVRSYYRFSATAVPSDHLDLISPELVLAMAALQALAKFELNVIQPKFTYIPTLRGTAQLQAPAGHSSPLDHGTYSRTVEQNYGLTQKEHLTIWTGLNLYHVIREHRNAPREKRNRFEAFEEFLSLNFFLGKSVDVVAVGDPQFIHLGIEGSKERELHHLGDGVQALLNLMFPLFMCDDGQWFFIEEPEVHLHPGFQTLLMRTLLHNEVLQKKKLKVFITTHSNHLLDTSLLDSAVSIFTMTLEGQDGETRSVIRQVEGGDVDILDCLGVANSSVFLAQCSIWIEGVTDRLILAAYLEVYTKKHAGVRFAEDLHYGFLEYAGSNIRHYLFSEEERSQKGIKQIKASAIGNRVWLLADQDTDDLEKQERHAKLKNLSTEHFQYITTGSREIENSLPWSIISAFLIQELNVPEEMVDSKRITESSYHDERLGTFLQQHFREQLGNRKLSTRLSAITPYYKNKLADYVYRLAQSGELTYEQLSTSPEAIRLATSLYTFLTRNCKI